MSTPSTAATTGSRCPIPPAISCPPSAGASPTAPAVRDLHLLQAGSSGTGNGQFSNPAGDALDPATGQLYVVDNGNDRVQVFGTSQASTTTVSSSANPSVPGQSVTYTAAVSPVPEQGTVAFADNGQPVTACDSQPVDGSTGNATCTVSYPGTGSHSVTATYSNSIGVAGSVSVGADAERPARRDHYRAHLLAQPFRAGPGRHLHRHRGPGRSGGRHPGRHGELLRRQHPGRRLHRPGPDRHHRHLHRDLRIARLAPGHRHLRRGCQLRRLGPVQRGSPGRGSGPPRARGRLYLACLRPGGRGHQGHDHR